MNERKKLFGYRRPDGRVGFRNHILILPISVCACDVAQAVAAQVEGAVSFHNQNGCSQPGKDLEYTVDVMAGFAANPNIYGTVAISLGCESAQMSWMEKEIRARTSKPLETLVIQEEGGSLKTIEKAVRLAMKMSAEAELIQREEVSYSELIVGTECGGSDPTSGFAANPVVGRMSDILVDLGGTSILSETTEMLGTEQILARRAATPEVAARIYEITERYEESLLLVGENIRKANPSPGNIRAGITTLEEKSLGCIHKGGTKTIQAVLDYAKQVNDKGLVIMDTPGNDPSSVAGMVAGGAQIIVFTTGMGTPTGNPIAPVIKLTGNRNTFETMRDNMDFDASPVLFGEASLEELGESLLDLVVETANGWKPAAELLKYGEIAIMRASNYC